MEGEIVELKNRIIKALRGRVVPLILVFAVTMAAQALTNVRSAMGVQGVNDLTTGVSAEDLADIMTGSGITIVKELGVSEPTYTGDDRAAGEFNSGGSVIGFYDSAGDEPTGEDGQDGIVLSSGAVGEAVGPNISHKTQNSHGVKGDSDLNAAFDLIGKNVSRDAAALEFDFIPGGDEVELYFVFGSDEYNELSGHVNEFAIFINEVLRSVILVEGNEIPVRISTVNGGKSGTCGNKKNDDGDEHQEDVDDPDCAEDCDNRVGEGAKNWEWFINNVSDDALGVECPTYDVEADGFTVPIRLVASVTRGELNTIKIVIADTGNRNFDSCLFIKAGSFKTTCVESDVDEFDNPDPDGWGDPGTDISGCVGDDFDNCPSVWNPGVEDLDEDGVFDQANNDLQDELAAGGIPGVGIFGDACDDDDDNDGILDDGDNSGLVGDNKCVGGTTTLCDDNCQFEENPDQEDFDQDGTGDACDDDSDNDGVPDSEDNCPSAFNPDQADTDGDGIGDACDNCVNVANPGQENLDGDPWGSACDPDGEEPPPPTLPATPSKFDDADGDGVADSGDQCPGEDDTIDADGDRIPDCLDDFVDSDGDGVADADDLCPDFDDFADIDKDGLFDCQDDPCVDRDGDGYGNFIAIGEGVTSTCSGPDCDDNNPGINPDPATEEIPDNGIDEDCDPNNDTSLDVSVEIN